MTSIADCRARLMFVTLTCPRFERSVSPVLEVLHKWLDSWSGIGVIERGTSPRHEMPSCSKSRSLRLHAGSGYHCPGTVPLDERSHLPGWDHPHTWYSVGFRELPFETHEHQEVSVVIRHAYVVSGPVPTFCGPLDVDRDGSPRGVAQASRRHLRDARVRGVNQCYR